MWGLRSAIGPYLTVLSLVYFDELLFKQLLLLEKLVVLVVWGRVPRTVRLLRLTRFFTGKILHKSFLLVQHRLAIALMYLSFVATNYARLSA